MLKLDLDEGSETEENEERIDIQPPTRERRPRDFYGDTVHLTIHQEPTSFNEARSSPGEAKLWTGRWSHLEVWELTATRQECSWLNTSLGKLSSRRRDVVFSIIPFSRLGRTSHCSQLPIFGCHQSGLVSLDSHQFSPCRPIWKRFS